MRSRGFGAAVTRTVVLIVAVFVMVAAKAGAAEAATPGWSPLATWDPSTVDSSTDDLLFNVSCATGTACTAVGVIGTTAEPQMLAERWDGSSWTQYTSFSNPSSFSRLVGVSCPTATACVAVGDYKTGSGYFAQAQRWNGSAWSPLTPAVPSGATTTELLGISCTSATSCFAVGYWIDGPGDYHALIERFDGSSWRSQTPAAVSGSFGEFLLGVSCTAASACTSVGYHYTTSSGTTAPLVERWNGTSWQLQSATGPSGGSSDFESVSCAGTSFCVAVGGFTPTSGHVHAIAQTWNGSSWRPQATPLPVGTSTSRLFGISCSAAAACTAAGYFYPSSPPGGSLAERWNGKDFALEQMPAQPESSPNPGLRSVSCTGPTACIGVGDREGVHGAILTLAEGWGGPAWQAGPTANPSGAVKVDTLFGVSCVGSNYCLAGGVYDSSGGALVPIAEGFDGSRWSLEPSLPLPSGAQGATLNAASCWQVRACVVVGEYTTSAGVGVPLAEEWNGVGWSRRNPAAPRGSQYAELKGISCTSANDCAAVGFYRDSGGIYQPLAEHWNGSAWTQETVELPPQSSSTVLHAVSCAAPGKCTAAGNWDSSGTERTLIESRNGAASWSRQTSLDPAGSLANNLYGVSCTSTTACTVVGSYADSSDRVHTLAERLAGTWMQQTTAPLGGVSASQFYATSCPSGSACTAVGSYVNSTEYTLGERWDGTSWGRQQTVNPAAARRILYGISCATTVTCSAVGFSITSGGNLAILTEDYS